MLKSSAFLRFQKLEFDQIFRIFFRFLYIFQVCWNAFTFICNLVAKLVKSSYDCQFGYIKKSTWKKFEELGGGWSLILLQIQHQFTIRCLFITFGGKQVVDDQGLTMQDFASNHIFMTKIPLTLNKHDQGSSTKLLILQDWRRRKMLAAQLILYCVKQLQYCTQWPAFLFDFCDEAWVATNP
jgi:hypothetical protein